MGPHLLNVYFELLVVHIQPLSCVNSELAEHVGFLFDSVHSV